MSVSLDQVLTYLPYIVAGLAVTVAVAHRRGKEVPVLTALLDILTMFKPSPLAPNPSKPSPEPSIPADHPVLRQLLDMVSKLMDRTAPKQ